MGLPLDRDIVLRLVEEIEVVLTAHQLWLKEFSHTLLFDRASLCDGVDSGEHLKGPWHYSADLGHATDHPQFAVISQVRREMHDAANRLCSDQRQFDRMQEEDFDHCMSLSVHLNTLLRSVQLDIVGELLATDPLTGCHGRRDMLEKLKGERDRAVRLAKPSAICLMDFDHFKQVNDTRGHAAGDAALRQGIKFVMSHLRKYDSIFRFGGEEFLICLPDTPLQDALNIVERLRAGVEGLQIEPSAGEPFNVTASFGLVGLSGDRSVEESIEAADQALYRAKRGGRNWVEVEVELSSKAPDLRLVKSDLLLASDA